jgi:hypothetical protein
MTLILSKSELERMKLVVEPERQDNSAALRRAELKRLSEEKVKNWPNTLEAMRKKKENFLKERADQDELKRQEIDRQVSST